jgi:hypothetical protein
MVDAMQPRSLWPQTTKFDEVDIEKEERAAREARRQQRRSARRKSKPSKKIKRRAPVPA